MHAKMLTVHTTDLSSKNEYDGSKIASPRKPMVGIANNLTGMSLRRPSIGIALTNFICQKTWPTWCVESQLRIFL